MHVEFREQLSEVGSSYHVSSRDPIQIVGLETSALKTGSHLAGPKKPAFLQRGNSSSWLSTSFAFPSKSHF